MSGHRLGVVATVDTATALCDVTVDGTTVTALALHGLPVVGTTVFLEQRGTRKQDWVITGTQPPVFYFEQWNYDTLSVPNNTAAFIATPQNSMFLRSAYGSAWSGSTWTAPVEGVYTWTVVGHPLGTAGTRGLVGIQTGAGTVLARTDTATQAASWQTLNYTMWFPLAQTIQINLFQNSGGAQVQDTVARVAVMKLPL
jgi:hypothetical protein